MIKLGNILIFGDSYSTYKGFIPSGRPIYYWDGREDTDVGSVIETWWYQLVEETKSNLVLNDSWSGSTVCHTRYNNEDCSKTSSFVCRLNKLIEVGFFEKNEIDTVLIFGGTNDNWANSPLGELKFLDICDKDLFSFLPAVCYLINKLKEILPNARIVYIINNNLKPEISNGIVNACKYYGTPYIELLDIDKTKGHPTVKGMKQIKEQILKSFIS